MERAIKVVGGVYVSLTGVDRCTVKKGDILILKEDDGTGNPLFFAPVTFRSFYNSMRNVKFLGVFSK